MFFFCGVFSFIERGIVMSFIFLLFLSDSNLRPLPSTASTLELFVEGYQIRNELVLRCEIGKPLLLVFYYSFFCQCVLSVFINGYLSNDSYSAFVELIAIPYVVLYRLVYALFSIFCGF